MDALPDPPRQALISAMSQAPHEVYSEELSQAFRRGHPVAVPHPGFKDGQLMRPVGIGDVGYIQSVCHLCSSEYTSLITMQPGTR